MPNRSSPIASQNICSACEQAIRHGVGRLDAVPGLIKRIITEELWRERKVETGEIVKLNSFRELITGKRYKGWETNPKQVEAVIRTDPDVLAMWKKEMYGHHGGDRKSEQVIKHDIIMLDKAVQGTSRSYTVARLKDQRPDLFAQVKSGKLSANAAAIKAGFRKKKTALEQLNHWWDKATAKERDDFMKDKI